MNYHKLIITATILFAGLAGSLALAQTGIVPQTAVCPPPPVCKGNLTYGDPSPDDPNQCPRYACLDSQTVTPVPLPTVVPPCPQDCKCDVEGNVQYCEASRVPVIPTPIDVTPHEVPVVPVPVDIEAISVPVVPVRIEVTPTETAISVPSVGTGKPVVQKCPVGCTCENETTTCPASETKQIIVPVVSFVGAQEVTTVPVKIEVTPGDKVSITSRAVTAVTVEKVVVEGNRLFIGGSENANPANVLPHEVPSIAINSANVTSVRHIELKTEEQKPVYEVTGSREARLLFVIPVSVPMRTKIDAADGKIISVQKPWWNFLAW